MERHRLYLNNCLIILLSLLIGMLVNLPLPFLIRLPLGVLFFFFLPGFSLQKTLKIMYSDTLTMLLLSVGFSLGIIALIGASLNIFLGVVNLRLITALCILVIICTEILDLLLEKRNKNLESGNKNQVKNYWEKYTWEKWAVRSIDKKLLEYYSQAYIFYCYKWLGNLNGRSILDAGMGDGRYLYHFLKVYRCQAFGVDISKASITLAKATAPRANILEADVENLPFKSDVFDVVISFGVIEHIDTKRALRELVRVARPGGTIIISVPNKFSPQVPFIYMRHWKESKLASIGKLFTISKVKELMKQEGLVNIAFGGIDIRPYLIKPLSEKTFLSLPFRLIETKDTWLNRWFGWMLLARGEKPKRGCGRSV